MRWECDISEVKSRNGMLKSWGERIGGGSEKLFREIEARTMMSLPSTVQKRKERTSRARRVDLSQANGKLNRHQPGNNQASIKPN
jgi:hypothetical protein